MRSEAKEFEDSEQSEHDNTEKVLKLHKGNAKLKLPE